MVSIVKFTHADGRTYAYESRSYYDPEKKGSRPKRKYLGRVDPSTGEIIPSSGKRGRPRKNPQAPQNLTCQNPDYKELYESTVAALEQQKKECSELRVANAKLKQENAANARQMQRMTDFLEKAHGRIGEFLAE